MSRSLYLVVMLIGLFVSANSIAVSAQIEKPIASVSENGSTVHFLNDHEGGIEIIEVVSKHSHSLVAEVMSKQQQATPLEIYKALGGQTGSEDALEILQKNHVEMLNGQHVQKNESKSVSPLLAFNDDSWMIPRGANDIEIISQGSNHEHGDKCCNYGHCDSQINFQNFSDGYIALAQQYYPNSGIFWGSSNQSGTLYYPSSQGVSGKQIRFDFCGNTPPNSFGQHEFELQRRNNGSNRWRTYYYIDVSTGHYIYYWLKSPFGVNYHRRIKFYSDGDSSEEFGVRWLWIDGFDGGDDPH